MKYNFTEEQNRELEELLEDCRYDDFISKVEEITGDVNLGFELLDNYYEMLSMV